MKKIVLLFTSVLLATAMMAQDEGFQFGFHISPTISWLSNNADNKAIESDGSQFAFKIGANGEWFFRENYAVKFGIGMAFAEGGNLKFNTIEDNVGGVNLFADSQPDMPNITQNSTANFRYQYIELPIGLKLRTNELNENMRYFMDIPILTFGMNVGARGSIEDGDDFRINDDTFLLQMSWGLGGGAEYSLNDGSGTAITGGIYYQSGFINTYNGKTGDSSIDDTKTTTNMIEIRLGVLF